MAPIRIPFWLPGLLRSVRGYRLVRLARVAVAAACIPAGCSRAPELPELPKAPGPASYGKPESKPATPLRPARPDRPDFSWRGADLAVVQTELSPAVLVHANSRYLGLFRGLAKEGLGPPAFVAFNTPTGPKIYRNGQHMNVRWVEENWVLVWWAGVQGWTNWDSPWVVYLQHKPRAMRLDEEGLHLEFTQPAGDLVFMPLYGYFKPPQPGQGKDFLAEHGLASKNVRPWEWTNGIPREPLMRIKYWSSATRRFPVYCQDTFAVDGARDAVVIRQRYRWHVIEDDWHTRPIKVAPISPVLALAIQSGGFPVAFSHPVRDYQLFTPYGPFYGAEQVDALEITVPVLRYVHETERAVSPPPDALPVVHAALDRLRATARQKFPSADTYLYDHGGLKNFCWAIQGDQWYARALPYLDGDVRTTAVASLRKYFRQDVLVPERFTEREFPKGSGRTYFILEGPGIGSWGVLGDAGKFSTKMIETVWAYAHYAGDWELVAERWPLIKKLFCTGTETRWVGFGRDAIAELGDEAGPCLAFARLAYKVGDMQAYRYGCYLVARELVHHWVKQRGAEYFRKHQPWHSMEPMDEEVYLTNLWGDTAGWQIDGPTYPSQTPERQFENRWVRFHSPDVARFYRDFLQSDVRTEMDRLTARWPAKRRRVNDSHIMPSLVQLRSLLLNERPEGLARLAQPSEFGGPPSGVMASCIAMLRTSRPPTYERLIAGDVPGKFEVGLEREVAGPNPHCVVGIEWTPRRTGHTLASSRSGAVTWPRLTWWRSWRTPAGRPWTFGTITPLPGEAPPAEVKIEPLNWNTRVVIFKAR